MKKLLFISTIIIIIASSCEELDGEFHWADRAALDTLHLNSSYNYYELTFGTDTVWTEERKITFFLFENNNEVYRKWYKYADTIPTTWRISPQYFFDQAEETFDTISVWEIGIHEETFIDDDWTPEFHTTNLSVYSLIDTTNNQ